MRSRLLGLFAALAGAGLVGALDALLALSWTSSELRFQERLFTILLGNACVAILLGLVMGRRWSAEQCFLGGAFLGLAPLFASLGSRLGILWSVAAALACCWLLAGNLRRLRFLPAGIAVVLGLATLAAPWVTWAWFRPPLTQTPLFAPPPLRPSLATGRVSQQKPDLFLVVADTLRADTVLDPAVPTPNLDRLRAEGLWAEAATAPSNQTLPSHLVLLTGLDIEKLGMRSNTDDWPTRAQLVQKWDCRPIASRFQRGGWRTTAVVSNPLLSQVDHEAGHQDFAEGFETWNGLKRVKSFGDFQLWTSEWTWYGWLTAPGFLRRPTAFLMRHLWEGTAVAHVRSHLKDADITWAAAQVYLQDLVGPDSGQLPFFFLLHFMDPHAPYVPPDPHRGQRSDSVELPRGFRDRYVDELGMRERLRRLQAKEEPSASDREQIARLMDYLRALYEEELMYLDEVLGHLFEWVERSGRPTVILFTADHGEGLGEHEEVEHGLTNFESVVAVPLVLWGTEEMGLPAGRLDFAPELVDAARTLLGLVGLSTEGIDGQDLLAGEVESIRPALSVREGGCALRDGRWKLHFTLGYPEGPEGLPVAGSPQLEPIGLYDLEIDPDELVNLLPGGTQQERVQRLQEELETRLREYDLAPFLFTRELSAELAEQMQQLGYVEIDEG